MAPAQIIDISNQNNDKYTHKKFQGKRSYAHKKFGTRIATTTAAATEDNTETHIPAAEEGYNTQTTFNTKRSASDIFRPYALPDNTSRKRKHYELQTEQTEECTREVKRFARSLLATPSPSFPPPPFIGHLMLPPPMMLHSSFCLQQYQFNSQTYALILQKQRAALCMGEILKRQGHLNLYNLMRP